MRLRSRYPVPKRLPGRRFILAVMAANVGLLAFLLTSSRAVAQTFTLRDGNAFVELRPFEAKSLTAFTLDGGPNRVVNSGFWYSGYFGEHPLPSLALSVAWANQTSPGSVTADYLNFGYSVSVNYTLNGGTPGSGIASLTEDVTLRNYFPTGGIVSLNLFEYNHYALAAPGLPADQARMMDSATVFQQGTDASLTASLGEPPMYELGDPALLLDQLTDTAPTTLVNTPPIGSPFATPSGDVAFCFEWPLVAPERATVSFRITKTLRQGNGAVPEPASLALLAMGAPVLLVFRPRKALTEKVSGMRDEAAP